MNLPLSFSPIATTSSTEETESLFQEQLVTSKIMKTDNARAVGVEMNGVSLGNSSLSCIRHRSEYEIDCGDIDNEGSIIFGYGSGRPSSTSFNGQSFDVNQHASIITRHSNVTHKRRSESYEFLIHCSSEAVETRMQSVLDRHLSRQLHFERSMPMNSPVGVNARSTVSYIMNSLDANPGLLKNPLVVANFEELLLGVIVSLPSNYSAELSNPHKISVAPGVVARAEAFIEANAHLPITMSDVFAHVSCSRNTLFKNFRKFRGYTPWEFLTTIRLKLVHQGLLNATESDSVTSIAHSLGFTHMGRFSQIYRKRYGEKPSETIGRTSN
jgi:AraC-like DNA-binding protein